MSKTPPQPLPRIPASLSELRQEIGAINHELLALLSRRAVLAEHVREYKSRHGMDMFSPSREQEMLESLLEANPGPSHHHRGHSAR